MTEWLLDTGWLLNSGSIDTGYYKKWYTTPLYAIIDHLLYRILPKNTTFFDFGRKTWWNLLKGLFLVCLSGSAISDHLIQVENKTSRPLGLCKGWPSLLNRGENNWDQGKRIQDFDSWPLTTGWCWTLFKYRFDCIRRLFSLEG